MTIRDMFLYNINRKINGVIKVDQAESEVLEQEVSEYVITRELKKHFISFFDYYSEAFDQPTDDIGVWISGFFGSGKSHFLKMLSYILENKKINGVPTVEFFRKKFEDDPGTFMLIDKATKGETETILFNIDIEGSINKDKTAVLKVFAKTFYNHLGYYGDNLKVAMLEQYLDQLGKLDQFRTIFAQKKGKDWNSQRKAFAFNGKTIIPTLMEVLDMSQDDAKAWFADKTAVEFSIARLVEDIKAYVKTKPKNFRLLFMIDEVGQYVGTDTDMLLNLQSLTEKIGSECGGKVWVVCTGQEAIDEIIKVRADEFSRIQARFKTRLSLSSSSVDEVIQKRILQKTPESQYRLEMVYSENDSTLRNLFCFQNSVLDIKGYSGSGEFAVNFPFVPYQFTIMQKVFAEIRKHGNSGKHLSGGERSMLSGFQEAAQKIQDKDENALVPFFRFYDTVHSFLDSSIRRVIERCQKAAENGHGIETQDVDLLKLLYLIRYVDDIPASLDNLVILMADNIQTDKIVLRENVRKSLDRLLSQNYIGRTGDTYNFLTDEEQDIQREIKNTMVDTASIVSHIGSKIFMDIYSAKKYRYGKYDFDFDKLTDDTPTGMLTGGMKLRFLTVATDAVEKSELRLMTESKGQAIVILSDTGYYEDLETALKIQKYVKQQNVPILPKSVQDIIRAQMEEAGRYESAASRKLTEAIIKGKYYVDGEHIEPTGEAKAKIDQALEYLVMHVYSELNLITKNAESDADILAILTGKETYLPGMEPNKDAAVKIDEFLDIQDKRKLPTSMADIQRRYQAVPYGWKEIDIAAVVALLIYQQKVTIKYAGTTIQPNNSRLPDLLRKKTEIGNTRISKRQIVAAAKMKKARELLREYFDVMDVPDDEDGLVDYIVTRFTDRKNHYQDLLKNYQKNSRYPDKDKVTLAEETIDDILSQKKDNIALIDRFLKREDDLFDSKEDLQAVENFFKNQVQIFDAAAKMEKDLHSDLDYLAAEPEANQALNQIRLFVKGNGTFQYKKVPGLNNLMKKVEEGHNRLLEGKKKEIKGIIVQCMGVIHQASQGDLRTKEVVTRADNYFSRKEEQAAEQKSLALLDGLVPQMLQYKDQTVAAIEALLKPDPVPGPGPKPGPKTEPVVPKTIKNYQRSIVFPARLLESEEDIDKYCDQIREHLKQYLRTCDGIQLK